MKKKRSRFPIREERQEVVEEPVYETVDCSDISRVEFLEDDSKDIIIEGDTLKIGRGYLREAKMNAKTGAPYFDEGHTLFDIFSHNCPETNET